MVHIENFWNNPFKELQYGYRCPYCGKLLYWEENPELGWAEWRVSTNDAFIRHWLDGNPPPLKTHACGLCAEILKKQFRPDPEPTASTVSLDLKIATPDITCEEGKTASFYESAKGSFWYTATANVHWLIRRYMEKAAGEILRQAQEEPASLLEEILPYLQNHMRLEAVLQTDWGKRTIGEIHASWKWQTAFPVFFIRTAPTSTHITRAFLIRIIYKRTSGVSSMNPAAVHICRR